jgi:hypothetical protein
VRLGKESDVYLKVKLLCVAAFVAAFAFPSSSFAFPSSSFTQCLLPKDMNGVWKSDDGGTYYVRQVGNSIWWVGMSGDGGKTWTNVYHGVRNGSIITGTWADVPMGRTRQTGILNLKIEFTWNNGVAGFSRTQVSGGFFGSEWEFRCPPVNSTVPVDED